MLFNSLEFAIFFPLVAIVFFSLKHRFRVPWLLIASCVFYMAFVPSYILILCVTILVDFYAGIRIERTSGRTRWCWLWGSIICTCAILFVFKYYNFFLGSFASGVELLGGSLPLSHWNIILPIGLSFHTFQSLSYVIEVYRGYQKAEYSLVRYSTYVMFFPQLVAGPIERPQNLLGQFCNLQGFNYNRVTSGLKRMAWGFFKKLVVADTLALYVNDVYADPHSHNGLQLSIATVFFAYQIYCDFSGYSDIAIGTARVLGFRLMENFNAPYFSKSISEFWRRWHISLSTWFRDYVYVPLGGSRVGRGRQFLNLMIVFGISGLWHGAAWTYVSWGILNGIYLVCGSLTRDVRNRFFDKIGMGTDVWFRRFQMMACTYFLTLLAWMIFRAESIDDAGYILRNFANGWDFSELSTQNFLKRQFPLAVFGIVTLEIAHMIQGRVSVPESLMKFPIVPRWTLYIGFVLMVVLFGTYQSSQFIYFQF